MKLANLAIDVSINFGMPMSKIKFVKYPRSIVRRRLDHPSSLFVTIPKRIVSKWSIRPAEIVEFIYVNENEDIFIKVRKIAG
jgi:hypothetical protein